MTAFTVYLFVRTSDETLSAATNRRLHALQVLRDELTSVGIRVVAVPDHADLEVEIKDVFAPHENESDQRVLVVRLSMDDERLDFVCADGAGRASAEQLAAKRVLEWLDYPVAGGVRVPQVLRAEPATTVL